MRKPALRPTTESSRSTHQLAVTRLLLKAVLEEGPGWRYLIQHSAGSGNTTSIGRSSHLLADLHDANDRKLFDTVLVVSDRSVIDSRLQETRAAHQAPAWCWLVHPRDRWQGAAHPPEALDQLDEMVACRDVSKELEYVMCLPA